MVYTNWFVIITNKFYFTIVFFHSGEGVLVQKETLRIEILPSHCFIRNFIELLKLEVWAKDHTWNLLDSPGSLGFLVYRGSSQNIPNLIHSFRRFFPKFWRSSPKFFRINLNFYFSNQLFNDSIQVFIKSFQTFIESSQISLNLVIFHQLYQVLLRKTDTLNPSWIPNPVVSLCETKLDHHFNWQLGFISTYFFFIFNIMLVHGWTNYVCRWKYTRRRSKAMKSNIEVVQNTFQTHLNNHHQHIKEKLIIIFFSSSFFPIFCSNRFICTYLSTSIQ